MPSRAATAPTLPLDDGSMSADQLSMPALMRELTLQQRPSWLLARFMNALEERRQAQGMGWSRPWNKVGLTIFRTQTPGPGEDPGRHPAVEQLLRQLLAGAPERMRAFASELLADPARMTFTFFHNHVTGEQRQYEGFTLSFGRHAADDPTKRDRLDIILEDERRNGAVDGRVDRLRVYVCPWWAYGTDRSLHVEERLPPEGDEGAAAQALFSYGVERYNVGKFDDSLQWSHWSQRYIDYFGPRTFIPRGSSFA